MGVAPAIGTSRPAARAHHSGAFDPSTRSLYIFGGDGDAEKGDGLNDLWTFSLKDNSWTEIQRPFGTAPDDRVGHVSWVDPTNHTFYVHGGRFVGAGSLDVKYEYSDTWAIQPTRKMRIPIGNWTITG